MADFKELNGREMETLGRLNTPLYKARDQEAYRPVDWEWAIDYAAKQFSQVLPERSFFTHQGAHPMKRGLYCSCYHGYTAPTM